jgi:hypothetical protein
LARQILAHWHLLFTGTARLESQKRRINTANEPNVTVGLTKTHTVTVRRASQYPKSDPTSFAGDESKDPIEVR